MCYSLFSSKKPTELAGKRVVLFSYGSGLASAMYSLRFSQDPTPKSSLSKVMATLADIPTRLQLRRTTPPAEFEEIMKLREDTHHKCPYTPVSDIKDLFPGTYYLAQVDDKYRRTYLRVLPTSCEPRSPLISPARLFNGSC